MSDEFFEAIKKLVKEEEEKRSRCCKECGRPYKEPAYAPWIPYWSTGFRPDYWRYYYGDSTGDVK